MKNIKVNGVQFRGQFGEAFEKLNNSGTVVMEDFRNGKWDPTVKVSRFLQLLDLADVKYRNSGESLRSANIELLGYRYKIK